MQNAEYWARRAESRMEAYSQQSARTARILQRAYTRAMDSLTEQIGRIYDSYGKRFGLTPEEARAMLDAPCGYDEYKRLAAVIQTMEEGPEKAALAARASSSAYAWRVNRLDNLRDGIRAQTALLAQDTEEKLTEQLRETIRYADGHTAYDLQRGTGIAWPYDLMDARAVEEILRNPWSGVGFSTRIWRDLGALGTMLDTEITQAFMTGQSSRVVARVVADRMGVGYRQAYRLVRTETAAMAQQAELACYKKSELDKYRFLATLDMRTSKVCQEHDGKVYLVKDAKIGDNMPPLHPHCRSTTVPFLGAEELKERRRAARDPVTGEHVTVPQDMTYKEWIKLQEDTYGEAAIQAARKRATSKKT